MRQRSRASPPKHTIAGMLSVLLRNSVRFPCTCNFSEVKKTLFVFILPHIFGSRASIDMCSFIPCITEHVYSPDSRTKPPYTLWAIVVRTPGELWVANYTLTFSTQAFILTLFPFIEHPHIIGGLRTSEIISANFWKSNNHIIYANRLPKYSITYVARLRRLRWHDVEHDFSLTFEQCSSKNRGVYMCPGLINWPRRYTAKWDVMVGLGKSMMNEGVFILSKCIILA